MMCNIYTGEQRPTIVFSESFDARIVDLWVSLNVNLGRSLTDLQIHIHVLHI